MSYTLNLHVVEFGTLDACLNMALDSHLLDVCEADNRHGFLRFYGWSRPTLSLGFFEDVGVIDCSKARRDGIDIVRRPTVTISPIP
jgi:lipoate-protein ligase A